MSIAALIFLSFLAYGKWQTEYARIQSRVEITQAKVDSLADELQATTSTIHAAIKSLTDRLLAGDIEVDEDEQLADSGLFGAARSGKWSEVRRDFLKLHPTCEACGVNVDLNVHHIKLFSQFPDLELEPTNLITLCRKHHFEVGHLGNWRTANATVREDAAKIRIGLGRAFIPTAPTIIMHTMNGCGPCKKWISNDKLSWEKAGWRVEILPPETGHPAGYPWYKITDRDGSQFEVNGPLNRDNFQAAKSGK